MRACAAILILAALPYFIHAQKSRSRETIQSFENVINENLIRLVPCVQNLGLSKCVSAYGVWRAENALQTNGKTKVLYGERFPWQRYSNLSDIELNTKLCDGTEKLLQQRYLKLDLNEDYSLELGVIGNGPKLHIGVIKSDAITGRGRMKKYEKYFYELVPFLLIPGLLMSAVLPFFLPTLKLMTVGAGMLNNIALTGAVFTLLRNNAFNDNYDKKVIYLNNGYLNDEYEPFANTQSEFIVAGDFDKYNNDKYTEVNPDAVKDFNAIGNEPLDNDYQVSSDWLKQFTDNERDIKVFGNSFKRSD